MNRVTINPITGHFSNILGTVCGSYTGWGFKCRKKKTHQKTMHQKIAYQKSKYRESKKLKTGSWNT